MAENDATRTLLVNIQAVMSAFRENAGDTRKTYDQLSREIPTIGEMPWNTFRTRLAVVVAAWESGYAHQSDTVRYLANEISRLKEDLAAARPDKGQIQSDIEVPGTMEGWSINQHKRGFWRAFRKVGGKSRCVYLGTKFDPIAAQEKLVDANARLNAFLS